MEDSYENSVIPTFVHDHILKKKKKNRNEGVLILSIVVSI
jgi:hypothetical protein